jgi:hypothetical protein
VGLGLSAGVTAFARAAHGAELKCELLASLKLDSAAVASAMLVPAGGGVAGAKLLPAVVEALPAFCRVQVMDRPSKDSEIKIEVWLPVERWNGKYRGQGNTGFAGLIRFEDMAAAVTEGYARAGTDTGHEGSEPDFALGHPEKVTDFGWRAIHDMTVEAKAIAAAFYGKDPAHSYFASCSNGGREGLMEAQRFPADYDGILAGAPGYNWTSATTG